MVVEERFGALLLVVAVAVVVAVVAVVVAAGYWLLVPSTEILPLHPSLLLPSVTSLAAPTCHPHQDMQKVIRLGLGRVPEDRKGGEVGCAAYRVVVALDPGCRQSHQQRN